MSRHIEAWMNGIKLSNLGFCPILIQEVQESAPTQETTYLARPVRPGQDVQKNRRTSLRVTIYVAIRELYNLQNREVTMRMLTMWASGGILELSYRPSQRLHVIGKASPTLGNVRDYTSRIAIELEANTIPFWEDTTIKRVTGTSISGNRTLVVGGNASDIPINITFTPTSSEDKVNDLQVIVTCGGVTREIRLTGMDASGPIVFDRDDCDRLTIKSGSTSLLRYRTDTSSDDLTVPSGTATIIWQADVAGTIVCTARGRWL